MSLLQKPELLIADEITTALDVTLEAQILHLLRELRTELNGSILFISHNLGAVAEICDSVVVLYAGEVVEQGPVSESSTARSIPIPARWSNAIRPASQNITRELPVIPGDVPNLRAIPEACIFAPRCRVAIDRCRRAAAGRRSPSARRTAARCHLARRRGAVSLLSVRNLNVRYAIAGPVKAMLAGLANRYHRCGARCLLRRRRRARPWRSSAKAVPANRPWPAPSSA